MGTWALKKEEIPSLIQELEAWKKHAYHIAGDDMVFDYIGAAIRRLKKLSAAERGNYDVSRGDPQFTGTKLDADFHTRSYPKISMATRLEPATRHNKNI